jgi:hypothetical protein
MDGQRPSARCEREAYAIEAFDQGWVLISHTMTDGGNELL